ncbi:MAG: hypothetical protein ABI906_04775 [Pseudomonadota bacterium]
MFNAVMGKAKAPSGGLGVEACRAAVAHTFEGFFQSDYEQLIWSFESMALGARSWDVDYLKQVVSDADVRIVVFARYFDDWMESLMRQNIWIRAGARGERIYAKPLRPITAPTTTDEGPKVRPARNTLAQGVKVHEALRTMRTILPSAEIIVRSFDVSRVRGTVVSDALAAMGVPADDALVDPDAEAGVRNPTKADSYSMLLYHLETVHVGLEVVRGIAAATKKRERKGQTFKPLEGRRFRFLSEENVIEARGYYDRLRKDYPELPEPLPYVRANAERFLPKAEGLALLDWLRPDLSDALFAQARAAYPADPEI